MPANQVRVDNALTAGLRAEFVNTYRQRYDGVIKRMGNVMTLAIPSDKRAEIFGYYETAPYPRVWNRGDPAHYGTFDSKQWTVANLDWQSGVMWHEDDEQDDQLQALVPQAQSAGDKFATLDERVFFQILTAGTDANLLASIPNAPDGVDLYNATDGAGGDRFKVSGGNIVSGQTLTTAAGIRAALFTAVLGRYASFKDTQSQPLFDMDSILAGGFTVFYAVGQEQLVREAVVQSRTLQLHAGTSTTDTTAAAAVTNIVLESGLRFELVPTQRLSGTTMYVFANGVDRKAIFSLSRQPLRMHPWGMENSDQGRNMKERGTIWECRRGYGVGLPYATIQITS